MKKLVFFLSLVLLSPSVWATSAEVQCLTGTSSTGSPSWAPASTTNPCPVTATVTGTSAVNITQINGTAVLAGAGATGAGSLRVTVAQDAATLGGSAPGTAGTASANVVTVQGIAGMTKFLVTPDANAAINLAQIAGTNTVNGGLAGSISVGGTVATNTAISANPLNLGAQAVSSENTAVTTARQVQLVADLTGKLIVSPFANKENFVKGTTASMTGTTSTSLVGAVASQKLYITHISCVNSSTTVPTFITVQDGSGGTALTTLAANSNFGGDEQTGSTPLFWTTAGNALFVANVTTGAAVICNASGYSGT